MVAGFGDHRNIGHFFILRMPVGPERPDPEIGSRCYGALRFDFGWAGKLPRKQSGPIKNDLTALVSEWEAVKQPAPSMHGVSKASHEKGMGCEDFEAL